MVSSLRGSKTIPFLYGRQSLRKLLNMLFDRRKTFRTDDMLDAAGVVVGDILRDAEIFQDLGDHLMPLIDHLRDRFSLIGKINVSGVGYSDLILFPQILHGDADAGLLKIQLIGDVHGADDRKLLTQYQNRLQIHFRRLVAFFSQYYHLNTFSGVWYPASSL